MQQRHVMVALCAACTLLNYADRVNMSVVILPMAAHFHWDTKAQATVMSSFFAGYLMMQLGGAVLARRFGAKIVLAYGATIWSLLTALTPVFAKLGFFPLLLCRFGMGLSEGVAFPSIYHFLAGWVPPCERGRAISLFLTGVHVGTTVALILSPHIIHALGWEYVFYIFGAAGSIWIAAWLLIAYDKDADDEKIQKEEDSGSVIGKGSGYIAVSSADAEMPTRVIRSPANSPTMEINDAPVDAKVSASNPVRGKPADRSVLAVIFSPAERRVVAAILTSVPCLAVCFTQFSVNLTHYVVLTWLPTYFQEVWHTDIKSLSFTAVPYVSMAVLCNCGGFAADYLAARGMPLTRVRKVVMTVSTVGASLFFVLFGLAPSVPFAIVSATCALVFMSLATGGFEASYMDMASPSLAGTFKSVGNTLGALSGFAAMPYTTLMLWLLKGSWPGVFASLSVFHVAALFVFSRYSTAKRILVDEGEHVDLPW